LEVYYEKYFEACKSSSCTYTYMSASSFAEVAAVIIGGINNATTATFKIVYSVTRGVVVPKKFRHRRDQREGSETPATEAHSSRNPV